MVDILSLDLEMECGLVQEVTQGVCAHSRSLYYILNPDFHLAMRQVLLRMVTQCAILEDFGILLVLADKVWGDDLWSPL